jgi:hypothetical protein
MNTSAKQRLGLCELKQHIPRVHEEYLQTLVQRKLVKIEIFYGIQTKAM